MSEQECVHCGNPDAPETLEYPIGIVGEHEDIHLEFSLCEVCHRVFTLDVATFNDYNGQPATPDAVYSTLNSLIDEAIENQVEEDDEDSSHYDIEISISVDTDEEAYHEYLDWLDGEKSELPDIAKMHHLMSVLNEPYQLNQDELMDLDVEMDIEKSENQGDDL